MRQQTLATVQRELRGVITLFSGNVFIAIASPDQATYAKRRVVASDPVGHAETRTATQKIGTAAKFRDGTKMNDFSQHQHHRRRLHKHFSRQRTGRALGKQLGDLILRDCCQ
jgi:hypothetical protein